MDEYYFSLVASTDESTFYHSDPFKKRVARFLLYYSTISTKSTYGGFFPTKKVCYILVGHIIFYIFSKHVYTYIDTISDTDIMCVWKMGDQILLLYIDTFLYDKINVCTNIEYII